MTPVTLYAVRSGTQVGLGSFGGIYWDATREEQARDAMRAVAVMTDQTAELLAIRTELECRMTPTMARRGRRRKP